MIETTKTTLTDNLREQLDRIESYSKLAAKNVLDADDAALLLSVSKSTLYKMTCNHVVPFYRAGGKMMRFDRAELENWMKTNRVATDAELATEARAYNVQKGGRL